MANYIIKFVVLTSGTSWTVPSDYNYANSTITLISGGGGSSGSTTSGRTGSGGGGGACLQLTNYPLSPGQTVTYAIGAAGTAGTSGGGNGGAGGTTTFDAYSLAGGGAGGNLSGGAGGAAYTVSGYVTSSYAGGNGLAGVSGSSAQTSGGGGAAGPSSAGGVGPTGGSGGTAGTGLTVQGTNYSGAGSGTGTAGIYGGGGGGQSNFGGLPQAGKAGAQGVIVIQYVSSTIIEVLTGSGNWTVPSDFNRTTNTIHLIGGGGGGGRSSSSDPLGYGGAGGGGGYTKLTNLNLGPGSIISYSVGSNGAAGGPSNVGVGQPGGSTTFTVYGTTYTAAGGAGGTQGSGTTPGTAGTGGIGSTYNGGNGSSGGVAGGGAGGPNGNGAAGSVDTGGTGGGGRGGAGGGVGANGNDGTDIANQNINTPYTVGSGGGAGSNQNNGGAYGGGGSGGKFVFSQANGGVGRAGTIAILYNPVPTGSGFKKSDDVFGTIDLDDQYVTDSWLVDKYVGGTLFAWGRNNAGQLGQGYVGALSYSSPIQVGALNNWKSSLGIQSNLAVKTDGTLWSWGYNAASDGGPLGQNNATNLSSPVQVGALTNWRNISAGTFVSSAIKTDGTLWVWGKNQWGQIGDGTVVNKSSPVQVGALTNWKQSSSSFYGGLAIKQDGTLWGWGQNQYGQIGNGAAGVTVGTGGYYSNPVQVGALTNWKQVSNSGAWILAVKTDGTLWSWGLNNFGQLGNNNTTNYSSPIQVGALTNWKQVSASGDGAAFAIKTDGTLWSWGQNSVGELGLNYATSTYYSSPIQVGSLTNWKYIAAGGGSGGPDSTNVSAIKTDGTLWTWGCNGNGELGQGNRTYYSSPIQVGSLTNWKYVGTGLGSVHAITFTDLN